MVLKIQVMHVANMESLSLNTERLSGVMHLEVDSMMENILV